MKTLLLAILFLNLVGCDQTAKHESNVSDISHQKNEGELGFATFVEEVLKREGTVVIFDQVIKPGAELSIAPVVGSGSMGYYVDDQFDLAEAGGFVRIEGSDGSSSGSSVGGTFSRENGPIQASYIAKNTGRLPRRLLIYTTKER